MSSEAKTAGFYGKLPALGDFVGRRLGRDFLTPWDDWLQLSIAASRGQLGETWLDTYLTSPLWRFVMSEGVCGDQAVAGVLMPSVDRVGRYFPLALVVPLSADRDLLAFAGEATGWFDAAEIILLSTLDDDIEFDLDEFDDRVLALATPSGGAYASPSLSAAVGDDDQPLRLPIASADALAGALPRLAWALMRQKFDTPSVWWTSGSEQVEPSLLVCAGLPPPESYASMLDGAWNGAPGLPMPPPAARVSLPHQAEGLPLIEDAGFPEESA